MSWEATGKAVAEDMDWGLLLLVVAAALPFIAHMVYSWRKGHR